MEVRDHDIECEECGNNTDLTACTYYGQTLCEDCVADHEPEYEDREE